MRPKISVVSHSRTTLPSVTWRIQLPEAVIRRPVAGIPWYSAVWVIPFVHETATLSPSVTVAWKVIAWSENDWLRPCMKPI